jgi:hypothetical protein
MDVCDWVYSRTPAFRRAKEVGKIYFSDKACLAHNCIYNTRLDIDLGGCMQRKLLGAILISAGVAACATKPVANMADNTPLHPTAVIEHHVVNNGIMGMFPFESDERQYFRSNMRRDEATLKGTGAFSGLIVGTRYSTDIIRLDRKVRWTLNADKAEYTECPLKGCVKPAKASSKEEQPAQRQPEAKHEPGCTMHIAHTSFRVKATGRKKSINGFDTSEYQVAWVVKLRDPQARVTTSTLNMDIWTTPMTGTMRDVLDTEESFNRRYNSAIAGAGKQEMLPTDAAKLISTYMASMLKHGDLKAFLDAGKQMEKIKGRPISTHLDWGLAGNACEPKESKKSADKSPVPSNPGDLVSGLAGMFAQKKTEDTMKQAGGEPILSFTVEVKKLAIEPVHDGEFAVPKNYKLVSQL